MRKIDVDLKAHRVFVHSTVPVIVPFGVEHPGGGTSNRAFIEGWMYPDNIMPDGRPYWSKGALVEIVRPVRPPAPWRHHGNKRPVFSDYDRRILAEGPLVQCRLPRKISLD